MADTEKYGFHLQIPTLTGGPPTIYVFSTSTMARGSIVERPVTPNQTSLRIETGFRRGLDWSLSIFVDRIDIHQLMAFYWP